MAPAGPYKLVTVNTAPERAKLLIGRVVEDFKDKYTFIHAANVESKQALPTCTLCLLYTHSILYSHRGCPRHGRGGEA